MPDTITRTTNQSWFSRIGGAISGVLFGLVLIPICIIALFWNEGRAIKTAKGLSEGAAVVVGIQPDAVAPENDQKLVHVTGRVAVTAPLEDTDFGVSATGVRLSRNVEMYQWRESSKSETRTKLGGGEETVTTYSYAKVWSSSHEDSSAFAEPNGHQNPEFAVESHDVLAQDATLGAFSLDEDIVGQIDGAAPMRLTPETLETVQAAVGDTGRYVSIAQNRIQLTQRPVRSNDPDDAEDAAVITPTASTIGDVRIGYELTPAGEISIVAEQNGDGFSTYRARNGEEFLLVSTGAVSAEDMFQGAQDANTFLTWALRIGGLVLLVVGFGLILAPLGVLADVLPLAGTIVRMGTGLVAFVLGAVIGTVTIAIAWFTFRPLLTIAILAVGGGIAFLVYRFGRGRAKKAETAT
ncbi:TMEM43 family protein [Brevundimonas sp.]|uniref:TMEM43 family protein n=1 Tax=Brevundimonas sp. TaxID=1871086 RepID=UPI003BABAC58